MKSQTSLVASQVRLQHWAEQIKDCQNRPEDMDVKTWCDQNGLTKANYYYRVRKVREACLSVCEDPGVSFVELEQPVASANDVMGLESIPQQEQSSKEEMVFPLNFTTLLHRN